MIIKQFREMKSLLKLFLISLSFTLLLPSCVCVLWPLRWSPVSLMVPKMHCGFVGAVRRKGVYACVCGQQWEVMRSFRHMRGFPSAAKVWESHFKGTYTQTHFHHQRGTRHTQTEEIHTLSTFEIAMLLKKKTIKIHLDAFLLLLMKP